MVSSAKAHKPVSTLPIRYPLPFTRLGLRLSAYPNAEVVWCQEEPENMGAWHFIDRRIERALSNIDVKAKRPRYIGRDLSNGFIVSHAN